MAGQDFVITGANGFVGTALCTYLRKLGHNPIALSRSNLDYKDADAVLKALSQFRSNPCLIHLAGTAHTRVKDNPDEIYRDSVVDLTRLMLQSAEKVGYQSFVLASTCKVYGELSTTEFTERSPTAPLSPYGRAKVEAEKILQASQTNIRKKVIRFPPMFGAGMKGSVRHLFTAAKQGIPLPLFGQHSPKRTFLSVDNAARFLFRAAVDPNFPDILNPIDAPTTTVGEFYEELVEVIRHRRLPAFLKWSIPEVVKNRLQSIAGMQPLFAPFEMSSIHDLKGFDLDLVARKKTISAASSGQNC